MASIENGNSEAARQRSGINGINDMENNRNEYKVRAKRLQSAIKSTFGVNCTSSQALELVAKEENYPSWDALSAISKEPNQKVEVAN